MVLRSLFPNEFFTLATGVVTSASQSKFAPNHNAEIHKWNKSSGGRLQYLRSKGERRPSSIPQQHNNQEEEETELNINMLRKIFDCVDLDGSGIVERAEMLQVSTCSSQSNDLLITQCLQALHQDEEVRAMIKQSPVLRPLLKKNSFDKHFQQIDTDDSDGGVSWDEFKSFCENEAQKLSKYSKTTRSGPPSVEDYRQQRDRQQEFLSMYVNV